MIKRILLWFFLILLILLAVLSYIGYRSFNQEAFKNQIVSSVQELTGRTFVVNGPYALTWDPLPTMTLEDVSLSNIENSANKNMFRADKIQIQIEWASLLKSPTRIKNIIVIKPEVLVERISRSVTNVDFPQLFVPNDTLQSETMLGEPKKQAKIDNIHIEDGSLQYINQMTKQTYRVTQLTGDIAVGSLSGPFGYDGNVTLFGVPFKTNLSLDKHEVSRPINFLADLTSKPSNTNFKVDGTLLADAAENQITGHLSLDIQRPNVLLQQMRLPTMPTSNNKQTIGNCAFNINTTKISISDLVLKIGSDENDPAISANWEQTHNNKTNQLNLDITSLNLDEWKATILKMARQKLLDTLSKTNFDINIGHAIWNSNPVSTLHLTGTATAGQIKIDDGSALLPGSTTIQMNGLIGTDPSNWVGLANINMQTQSLIAALPSLNLKQNKLTQILNQTQKAEAAAALQWSPQSLTITLPALMLDDTTGMFHYEEVPNEPIQITLELNNVDLNKYLPTNNDQPETIEQITDLLFNNIKEMPTLANPINAEIILNQVLVRKLQLQNLTADIKAGNATLNIEAVANTEKDDMLTFQTELQQIGSSDWNSPLTIWEVQGQNPPQLLQLLEIQQNNKLIQNTNSFAFRGQLSGKPGAWDTTLFYQTQALTFEAKGQLLNQQPNNMAIRLKHTSIPHFLVGLFDQNPAPLLTGEIEIQTLANQTDNIINFANTNIDINDQSIWGEATYDTQHKETHIILAADSLDATKLLPDPAHFYLPSSGFDATPFQFDLLKQIIGTLSLSVKSLTYRNNVYQNAQLQIHLANDTLTLDNFIASGNTEVPSTIQARGALEFSKTPTLNLKLVTQQLPMATSFGIFDGVGLSGGILNGEWNLTTSGETPLQMARTLSGSGQVTLTDSKLIGANFTAFENAITQAQKREEIQQVFEPKLQHALQNGSTPINSLEGTFTITDGILRLSDAKITTPLATSDNLAIDWDIPTTVIKATAPFKWNAYSQIPNFILTFIKDTRGILYTADINSFASALANEFTKQRTARDEAAKQAETERQQKEFMTIKEQAIEALKQLQQRLQKLENELEDTPNAAIQNALKTAQTAHATLSEMSQEENLNTTQYQYLLTQTNKAIDNVHTAERTLFQQKIQDMQAQAQKLMPDVQNAVLKLSEMYQKRPSMSLLADLLQNAQNQHDIMERAIAQFKKELSFEQTEKVCDIIQQAHDKVMKAYGYAEEIYSGRQNVPNNNVIQRATP